MVPATSKIDKVIVTNFSALNAKYGNAGSQRIQTAVQNLIAADQKRGLITGLYLLDDPATMQQFNVAPLTIPTDPKQNKDAVDAVYRALAPDYILILGSIDIVPHQDLKNPIFSSGHDADEFAFGDLPYACESPYSQDPEDFYGPTRVVGRLPDITGADDPQYLIDLLKIAATYKETAAEQYRPYFGISAGVWEGSTSLSTTNIFGNSTDLKTIPPQGPTWPPPLLNRFAHFINCHGAPADSHFYGQPPGVQRYPIALDAANLKQNISEGTVVAAECCYGAQLFDPSLNDGQSGICNTYLGNKAYGFFGSTTIAYGPSDSNDQADLICQYFLQSLLEGSSLGRATLAARQRFIHTASMYDPSNIKTIAQFNLYADPSVTPVTPPRAPAKGFGLAAPMNLRMERAERRRDFFSRGLALAKSQPSLRKDVSKKEEVVLDALRKAAVDQGLLPKEILTFTVKAPPVSKSMPRGLVAEEISPSRMHIVFGTIEDFAKDNTMKMISGKTKLPQVVGIVALIIKEISGTIASVKKIFSR